MINKLLIIILIKMMKKKKEEEKLVKQTQKPKQISIQQKISKKYIKSKGFIKEIKELKKKYFRDEKYERGGLLTVNIDNIEVQESNNNDNDGFILYKKSMLINIKSNQIIWHTHNINRNFNCEPPSGADIIIQLKLAKKKLYPYAIAIHNKGFWIYRITKELTENQRKKFKEMTTWTSWWINAINDIFCNSNRNVINNYDKEDLEKYGITQINTIEEYYLIINKIFNNSIYIEFIYF